MLKVDRIIGLPTAALATTLLVGLAGGRFHAAKELILYGSQFLICVFLIHRTATTNLIADRRLRLLFVSALAWLTFADATYCLNHYLARVPYASVRMLCLSIIPYFGSYCLASAVFLMLLAKGSGLRFLRTRIFWLTAAIFWFFTAEYIGIPVLRQLASQGASLMGVIHAIKLAGILILGPVALYSVFSAQDLGWSFIALGFFGFAILEWGLNAELLTYGTLRFSIYDLAWLHSVLMIATGILLGGQLSSRIEPVDLRRLSHSIRFYPTVLIAIPSLLLPLVLKTEIQSIVVTITAYYFLLFLAVVMTGLLLSWLDKLAQILGELSQRNIDQNNLANLSLPLEFQRIISSILSVRLNEQKEAAERVFASSDKLDKSIGQLVHDLRSPIAAIESVVNSLNLPDPKETALLGASFARVNSIISETLEQGRGRAEEVSDFAPLFPLKDVLLEKSFLLRGKPISFHLSGGESAHELMAVGNETEFKRIISNLIDNAVEAMPGGGQVSVALKGADAEISLTVEDTGRGIPADILPNLGSKPITHGKDAGHGLGLYHCFTTLRRWGADAKIQSSPRGTSVELRLRRGEKPAWLALSVPTIAQREIIAVDDSREILGAWQSMIGNRRDAAYCASFAEAIAQCKGRDLKNVLLLSDFDVIGDPMDGIDFYDAVGRPPHFLIVTGKHFLPELRRRSQERGIRILPKHLLSTLNLVFV